MSMFLVAVFTLSPVLFPVHGNSLRLGNDLPIEWLEDRDGTLTVSQVDALPRDAFKVAREAINQGYTRSVFWLKVPTPHLAPSSAGADDELMWLSIQPPHLTYVTLFQLDPATGGWHETRSGAAVPVTERVHARQMLFPLVAGQPMLLRVQSIGLVHVNGRVWRGSDLAADIFRTEWASGMYLGINLALALLIGGLAFVLRSRGLVATAVLVFVALVHSFNVRGYAQVWLPPLWAPQIDTWARLGSFLMPAAFAWQGRELFTRRRGWPHIDRFLIQLSVLLLVVGLLSVGTGNFGKWAWMAVFSPWIAASLCAWVAWSDMRRLGVTPVRVMLAAPYTLHAVVGGMVGASYTGLLPSSVEADLYWQAEIMLLEIMIVAALGARLAARQSTLVESLAQSEYELDKRVRQRTVELLQTQNVLQAALDSERAMREEQRQFFAMVNHEFRTPLAVMDSAAAEQLTFPSPELEPQRERAIQIRRACRRMTTLVDNCLASDRMDESAFRLQLDQVLVIELADDAAQIAQWSLRHEVRLDLTKAPAEWECDPMLVRIALSNLVDNAVKYARPGHIAITAALNGEGSLCLSVCDEGPGLPPDVQNLFNRGQRGDQGGRGFGLGLWVARRIAQLHGGDIQVSPSPQGGTCFTMVLPARIVPEPLPAAP